MYSITVQIFSSKSFNWFIISILKSLTANSNIWVIHRSTTIDVFFFDFRLPFPSSNWSYDSLGFDFVKKDLFTFALSLSMAFSPKAWSFYCFNTKSEVIHQSLKFVKACTQIEHYAAADISAQCFRPPDATFCLVFLKHCLYMCNLGTHKKEFGDPSFWLPSFWDVLSQFYSWFW